MTKVFHTFIVFVLATFSISAFGSNNKSAPICLTNIPDRTILYASKEYSGGETVRALRKIYYNVREYIRDPATRKEYIEYKSLCRRKRVIWIL